MSNFLQRLIFEFKDRKSRKFLARDYTRKCRTNRVTELRFEILTNKIPLYPRCSVADNFSLPRLFGEEAVSIEGGKVDRFSRRKKSDVLSRPQSERERKVISIGTGKSSENRRRMDVLVVVVVVLGITGRIPVSDCPCRDPDSAWLHSTLSTRNAHTRRPPSRIHVHPAHVYNTRSKRSFSTLRIRSANEFLDK